MTFLSLLTVRSRLTSLVGSFVALSIGTAILATLGLTLVSSQQLPTNGLGRFQSAPIVVSSPTTLTVYGNVLHDLQTQPLTETRPLNPALIDQIARTTPIVQDRTFYAQAPGGPSTEVGHAWSATEFSPYHLIAGHAPANPQQVVLTTGDTDMVGQWVPIMTTAGYTKYQVSGVTQPVQFETAILFQNAEAARLSPSVDAVIAFSNEAAVRKIVGSAAVVYTGSNRALADTQLQQDKQTLAGINTLLGITVAVSGCICVVIIGATFRLAVLQRRTEFALLRTMGATPGQVIRSVLAEAGIVGIVGGIAGSGIATFIGPMLGRWIVARGLAPSWFAVRVSWQSITVFVVVAILGAGMASIGAGKAAWDASRVRPAELLRPSTQKKKRRFILRWLAATVGVLILLLSLGTLIVGAHAFPLYIVPVQDYATLLVGCIIGFALIAVPLLRCSTVILLAPFSRVRGALPMLVRSAIMSASGRAAITVTQVMIVVGIVATIASVSPNVNRATTATTTQLVSGVSYVLTPQHAAGVNNQAVRQLQTVKGITTAAPVGVTIYIAPPVTSEATLLGDPVLPYSVQAINPASLDLFNLDVATGSLSNLNNQSIVLSNTTGYVVGDTVQAWLADGTPIHFRVAATLKTGLAGTTAYVTNSYAGSALPAAVFVHTVSGANSQVAHAQLSAIARAQNLNIQTGARWAQTLSSDAAKQNYYSILFIFGVSVVFSCIVIANTLVMSVADRKRELATLRLVNATKLQIICNVAVETLIACIVGIVLGIITTVAITTCIGAALRTVAPHTLGSLTIVWSSMALASVTCIVIALATITIAVGLALRDRAVSQTATREA